MSRPRHFSLRGVLAAFLVCLPLATAGCATSRAVSALDTGIDNVTIIDPASGDVRRDQAIRIRGDRIRAAGPRQAIDRSGGRILDGGGKYVVPGLWDMHVHLQTWGFADAFPLLVANGVLGVRDMGTDYPDHLSALRTWVTKGGAPGVRILHAGKMIDGPTPPDWPLRRTVRNPDEARAAVRDTVREGGGFIKVHGQLDRASYFAVAEAARESGMSFAGHVPPSVTGIEAATAGQQTLEHLLGTPPCESPACANAADSIRVYRDRGTAQVPTLVLLDAEARGLALSDEERRFVTPVAQRNWDHMNQAVAHLLPPPEMRAEMYRGALRGGLATVRAMHEAGVPLLAGSDFGYFSILPGMSLHRELELLVEAGLTPLEALRTATSTPAQVMDRETDFGSVERGKYADFILLDRNPLSDISALRDIHGVVAAGRLYFGEDRLRLLRQAEAVAVAD